MASDTSDNLIPAWCAPGATVTVLADGGRRGTSTAIVERVTKTLVIASGERYRVGRDGTPRRQPYGRHSTAYTLAPSPRKD